MIPRSVIVIGAGLAGCALARALTRRGCSVILIDDADVRAGSRQTALAVHPAHAPDASPASRLSRLGLSLLAQDAISGDGLNPGWWALPRLQRMDATRARALAQAWPGGPLELHQEGLLWTQPSAVDPLALLNRWQHEAAQQGRLQSIPARIASLKWQEDAWLARDERGVELARAADAVICMGYRSADLALPSTIGSGPWLHAAGWQLREGHCSLSRRPAVPDSMVIGVQGEGHQIPLPDGQVLYGPRGREDGLRGREGRPLGREGCESIEDRQALQEGVRASVRDHLPLAGALPDLGVLQARWTELRRNDRLPIPRQNGLWMLSALGGRGLLWCLPAAEHLAAQVLAQPSLLDSGLSAAIDPARFLRRALRSGLPDLTQALGLA